MKSKLKLFFLVLLSFGLVQCGKKGDDYSEKMNIFMPNKSPLVRVSPRTFAGSEIQANWFDALFMVQNTGDKDVRIEEILFFVTVDGIEGGPYSFDLGTLSSIDEDTNNTYDYMDYCTYPAGMTAPIRLATCANGNPDPSLALIGSNPLAKFITLFIGSLPKPKVPTLLAFPGRVELHGVVLDSSGYDAERFLKTIYFTTR